MFCFGMASLWNTTSSRHAGNEAHRLWTWGLIGFCSRRRKNAGTVDLADIYHRLSLSGQLAGYEVYVRFYEIGSHKGLAEAADYFKGGGE